MLSCCSQNALLKACALRHTVLEMLAARHEGCCSLPPVASQLRSVRCLQVYSALLHSTVKCNESELAVEVFRQMQLEGLPIDRSVYNLMVDVFVKMGTCEVRLQASVQLPAAGQSSPSLMALRPPRP